MRTIAITGINTRYNNICRNNLQTNQQNVSFEARFPNGVKKNKTYKTIYCIKHQINLYLIWKE